MAETVEQGVVLAARPLRRGDIRPASVVAGWYIEWVRPEDIGEHTGRPLFTTEILVELPLLTPAGVIPTAGMRITVTHDGGQDLHAVELDDPDEATP